MNFRALFLEIKCPKILETCIQTDGHFLKVVKPCSGHLKTRKCIKTGSQKFRESSAFFLCIQKKIKEKNYFQRHLSVDMHKN